MLRKVVAGEMTVKDAIMKTPKLKRVGGTCPCSRAVRWVTEEGDFGERRLGLRASRGGGPRRPV